jgi:hypothetical protein
MKPAALTRTTWLEYDALQRRLWIRGQRMHHGATGSLVAALACLALMTGQLKGNSGMRSLVAMAAAGGALMAHDWKDRGLWFELGRGSQP